MKRSKFSEEQVVYALIDEADDLVLLGGSQSHVLSSEPEARRFFKYAILKDRLGHNLLELAVFSAQVLDFRRRRFACRIAQQPLLPGLEELLAPAVIEIRRYPFAAAERRDALFPAEPLQHDPNLLFGRKPPARMPPNLPNHRDQAPFSNSSI